MLVSTTLTVSASTADTAPERATLSFPAGDVTQWWVGWHYGVGDLAGARVLYHEVQVLPWSVGTFLPSFRGVLTFPADLDVWAPPHELVIEGYNNDDTYAHTVWVAASIERSTYWADLYGTLLSLMRGGGYA